MSRMAFKTWIMDPLNTRVGLKELGHPECVLILASHPDSEGLQAAMKEKTSMGVERAAKMVELVCDALNQLSPADDGAGNDV